MGSGKIKDHQLIASTSNPTLRPEQARPHNDAWCALQTDTNPYIQVLKVFIFILLLMAIDTDPLSCNLIG